MLYHNFITTYNYITIAIVFKKLLTQHDDFGKTLLYYSFDLNSVWCCVTCA